MAFWRKIQRGVHRFEHKIHLDTAFHSIKKIEKKVEKKVEKVAEKIADVAKEGVKEVVKDTKAIGKGLETAIDFAGEKIIIPAKNEIIKDAKVLTKELESGIKKIPHIAEEVGEGVKKGLDETIKVIDIVKTPVQKVAKVGEKIGGVLFTVAPFIPPPAQEALLGVAGAVEAVSLGLDYSIETLNSIEAGAKGAKEAIDTTEKIVNKLKTIKKPETPEDLINIIKTGEELVNDVKTLKGHLETVKESGKEIKDRKLSKASGRPGISSKEAQQVAKVAQQVKKEVNKVVKAVKKDILVVSKQLDKMTVADLKKIARKEKINLKGLSKKSDIIKTINDIYNKVVIEEVKEIVKSFREKSKLSAKEKKEYVVELINEMRKIKNIPKFLMDQRTEILKLTKKQQKQILKLAEELDK